MDDSELPAGKLQIEPQDGCHPGGSVGSVGSRLPSASDENENQLDGCGQDRLTSSDGAMGKPAAAEEDSLNNNAGCTPGCEAAASETSGNTSREGPGDEQDFLGEDRTTPGKRSSSTKTGPARKIPPGRSSGDAAPLLREEVRSAATRADGEEESAEGNAHNQPEAPALQSLFSLIRGEVEQLDSRALPLCLHQIAESYFQEEDYEKAMKFIQLERLYHEQLLANLSAIQEQWETKWKTVQPRAVTSPRNSEKGFNGEDFERLTKFCATHQDPLSSTYKTAAAETALGGERVAEAAVSAGPQGSGAAAPAPESGTAPGMEPSGESQQREETPGSGPCRGQPAWRAAPPAPPRPPAAAGQHRTAEPPGSAANPELPAQPAQSAGEDGEDGSRPQPAPPEARGAAAEVEGPEVPPCSGAVTAPPASAGSEQTAPTPEAPSAPGAPPARAPPRKELQLPLADAPEARPADPPAPQDLKEPRQQDGGSPRGLAAPQRPARGPGENAQAAGPRAGLPEGRRAPEGRGGPDLRVSREAEDYLSRLLEGCLRGTEDALPCEEEEEEEEEDPDLPDLSPDEASYSLQDDLPSDGSLSPEDLARRIEIAEVVPAAGLVSILKKRNDAVGDHPAQMQQKPSKRRVRFQEIDDNLDQDEAGSGSCLLLVLLCIATVLLSVGGTALYCAFGDLESPVCTDFAHNVDFYYTKLLQGMAGLKHWVYLS